MKIIFSIPVLLLSMAAGASCPPDWHLHVAVPEVPDGSQASEAEMYQAQEAIKSYIHQASEYLDCNSASSLRREHTAANLEQIADSYNKQLKVFREKS